MSSDTMRRGDGNASVEGDRFPPDQSGSGDSAKQSSSNGTDRPVSNGTDPTGAAEVRSAGVTKDDLFKVLGNRRRRHVLHYLEWRDRPVRLDELAERIAAWENDTTPESVGSEERKRVYTALQQFHLQKLENAGLVEYDDRAGTISRTNAGERVDVYLDFVTEDDIPWSYYYVGVATIGLVLSGLSALGLPLLSALSTAAWAAGFIGVILGSALMHAHRDRRLRLGHAEEPPEIRLG